MLDKRKTCDAALAFLVKTELPTPCETLDETPEGWEWCLVNCKYDSLQVECWRRYFDTEEEKEKSDG